MAKLYIKKSDGTYVPQKLQSVTNIDVVQETGDSQDKAMSQKAVTDALTASDKKLSELEGKVNPLYIKDIHLNTTKTYSGQITTVPNTTTNIVQRTPKSGYITCEPIPLDSIPTGSVFSIKASITSNIGVYVFDANDVLVDYVNSTNAVERGYAIITQYQTINLTKAANAKYVATSLRDVYYTGIADFMVNGQGDGIIKEMQDDIDDIHLKIGDTGIVKKVIELGKNLFDVSKGTLGVLGADGNINLNNNYITSDYIFVPNGQQITLSPEIRMIGAFTDKNKSTMIAGSYINSGLSGIIVWTASQDCYVRATFYNNRGYENWMIQYGNAIQYESKTHPSIKPKIAYQEYIEKHKIEENVLVSDTIGKVGNILYGKKWVVIGDSFTQGIANDLITEGRYKGEPQSYPYLIGNRNEMNIVKFFQGGRTLAYPADGTFDNSITCPTMPWYYQNIPSDADYITIMLGINDLNHGNGTGGDGEDYTGRITLGTIDDTDTSTYYGAWNTVMSWLIVNRPFAHIGIIVTNGTQNEGFTNAQIEIAKKYGVPYINLNGDQHTPAMIRAYNPNLPQFVKDAIKAKQAVDLAANNTHPNTAAHNYESTFIEQWLRSL